MRLTGAQLHSWAAGCGANEYHPDTWTPVQRESFQAFKLQKFRDHCRWLERLEPRAWWPRAALIDTLRRAFSATRVWPQIAGVDVSNFGHSGRLSIITDTGGGAVTAVASGNRLMSGRPRVAGPPSGRRHTFMR